MRRLPIFLFGLFALFYLVNHPAQNSTDSGSAATQAAINKLQPVTLSERFKENCIEAIRKASENNLSSDTAYMSRALYLGNFKKIKEKSEDNARPVVTGSFFMGSSQVSYKCVDDGQLADFKVR